MIGEGWASRPASASPPHASPHFEEDRIVAITRSNRSHAFVAPSSRSWEDALQRLEGAYSYQTVLAYGSDFRIFADWCRTKRRTFLPATPETVAGYLDAISVDLKPATLRRRIAAISKIHRLTR